MTSPSFAQLSAPSGSVVWVLVGGARLFRSADRGDTWVERSLPTSLANVEVAFADDNLRVDLLREDGLLLSPGSSATQCRTDTITIWRTTDGAGSWQQLAPTGIADALCKRGLASAEAPNAFFTAYGPNSGPVIYRTTDGGRTWTASRPLPDPPGRTDVTVVFLPGRPRAFGSVVLVEARGYGQQQRYVFRSTDGGASWAYTSPVPGSDTPTAFVTASRWIQLNPPGQSRETTDGGTNWHAYATDYSQAAPIAPDIVFGDAMVGYATVRGSIQRTTDGGAHWTTIKTPGT
jgi:photosystem II stability/assembly factor-like uncharacterized protein